MNDGTSSPEGKEKELRRLRVLVVEGDRDMAFSLKMVVGQEGMDAFSLPNMSTSSVMEFLRRKKEQNQPIDIIFSRLGYEGNGRGGLYISSAAKEEGLVGYSILFTNSKIPPTDDDIKNANVDKLIQEPSGLTIIKESLTNAKSAIFNPKPSTVK